MGSCSTSTLNSSNPHKAFLTKSLSSESKSTIEKSCVDVGIQVTYNKRRNQTRKFDNLHNYANVKRGLSEVNLPRLQVESMPIDESAGISRTSQPRADMVQEVKFENKRKIADIPPQQKVIKTAFTVSKPFIGRKEIDEKKNKIIGRASLLEQYHINQLQTPSTKNTQFDISREESLMKKNHQTLNQTSKIEEEKSRVMRIKRRHSTSSIKMRPSLNQHRGNSFEAERPRANLFSSLRLISKSTKPEDDIKPASITGSNARVNTRVTRRKEKIQTQEKNVSIKNKRSSAFFVQKSSQHSFFPKVVKRSPSPIKVGQSDFDQYKKRIQKIRFDNESSKPIYKAVLFLNGNFVAAKLN